MRTVHLPLRCIGMIASLMLALTACGDAKNRGDEPVKSTVRPVKTTTVTASNTVLRRDYPATVLPAKEVELSFPIGGRIVELPIHAALKVNQGDIIAQLDLREFESSVTQLQSQLDQAKAQLSAMTGGARSEDISSLKAAVDAASTEINSAQKKVERSAKLFEKGVIAQVDLENDEAALAVAQSTLSAKQEELKKGQTGARTEEVTAQEAVLTGLKSQLQTAEDNLADATLRAPFSGIIATRNVETFSNVQAKDPIATLQQLETLDLVFDIPGPDVVKFSDATTQAQVILDSVPDQSFVAALVEFSTQADPATQTYRARVSISPPEGVSILPGMTGSVMVTDKKDGDTTIEAPITALGSEPDGSAFVWVVNASDNKVNKRPVEVGEARGQNVAIVNGLDVGETVVTAGVSYMQENMIVKPIAGIGN